MNRQAPGDKAEALTNTHIHEWLREGGTQLEVFRYLVLFLTGFVIGDLFLRAFLHARKSATRYFGQEEGLGKHEMLCVYLLRISRQRGPENWDRQQDRRCGGGRIRL
jgi:hypothetical protein